MHTRDLQARINEARCRSDLAAASTSASSVYWFGTLLKENLGRGEQGELPPLQLPVHTLHRLVLCCTLAPRPAPEGRLALRRRMGRLAFKVCPCSVCTGIRVSYPACLHTLGSAYQDPTSVQWLLSHCTSCRGWTPRRPARPAGFGRGLLFFGFASVQFIQMLSLMPTSPRLLLPDCYVSVSMRICRGIHVFYDLRKKGICQSLHSSCW